MRHYHAASQMLLEPSNPYDGQVAAGGASEQYWFKESTVAVMLQTPGGGWDLAAVSDDGPLG